jgi:hypothetical protein
METGVPIYVSYWRREDKFNMHREQTALLQRIGHAQFVKDTVELHCKARSPISEPYEHLEHWKLRRAAPNDNRGFMAPLPENAWILEIGEVR